MKDLLGKLYESFISVLPISVIVIILALVTRSIEGEIIWLYVMGAILIMLGMTLFSLGADIAMLPIGNSLGSYISKNKKIVFSILICFVIGFIITLAEPDLHVLSEQLKSKAILYAVAIGVGVFIVISLLRTIFKIKLKYILLVSYSLVFLLAIFVPTEFLGIAFDAGGVTTGPITVPFLVSFGIGLAAVRSGNSDHDDSFGLIALCSTGPILAILIVGLIGKTEVSYVVAEIPPVNTFGDMIMSFIRGIPYSVKEVSIALVPIAVVFFIFQFTVLKLPKTQVIRIIIGIVYTFIGLTLFLTGVNVGFMPMGASLGKVIAGSMYKWLLIPIGLIIGCVIVLAEPAVHILTGQVEEITGGSISRKSMLISLAIGVSISLGLSMLRVITGISIWYFLLPVYVISIVLSLFSPPIFTGIAFDSGGVAAGSMASAFLLPMAIGASVAVGGNVLRDAFGVVAFVAMTPLMTIQFLGLLYKRKAKQQQEKQIIVTVSPEENVDVISEFMEEPLEFDEDYETEVITLEDEIETDKVTDLPDDKQEDVAKVSKESQNKVLETSYEENERKQNEANQEIIEEEISVEQEQEHIHKETSKNETNSTNKTTEDLEDKIDMPNNKDK